MWDIYPEPYPDLKIFLGYAYALMGDYYELEQALEESAYFSDKETIQNILNAIDEILASDYSEKDIIAYLGWDFPAVNANGKPLYHSSTHGRSSLMYIKKILLQRLVDEPKISEDKKGI